MSKNPPLVDTSSLPEQRAQLVSVDVLNHAVGLMDSVHRVLAELMNYCAEETLDPNAVYLAAEKASYLAGNAARATERATELLCRKINVGDRTQAVMPAVLEQAMSQIEHEGERA